MTREIKFRVFDQVSKKIYPVKSIWGFPEVENVCVPFEDTVETLFHSFELMQFTGLADKKGVDIYEGDIVKGFIHGVEIEGQKNDVIVFQNGKFEFKNTPSDLISFCYPLSIKQIEIIGNIHEDSCLLE